MNGTEHQYALFRWARYRAAKSGIDFNITQDDIIIPMYCPILDIRLQVGTKVSGSASPTLDRIDNSLGYVKGNVWVISNLANMMKSKATVEQLTRFSQWVSKKYTKS